MNTYGFTRREVKALIILTIIAIIFIFIPQQTLDEWDIAYYFCFTLPFTLWIILDPERKK